MADLLLRILTPEDKHLLRHRSPGRGRCPVDSIAGAVLTEMKSNGPRPRRPIGGG